MLKTLIKKNTGFIKLKTSFIAVVILIQVLLIAFTLMFLDSVVHLLNKVEENKVRTMIASVTAQVDQTTSKALATALAISNNPIVTQALLENNRDKLVLAIYPTWEKLKPLGLAQLNYFIKPNGSNEWQYFYRAQLPQKFGDSIDDRPIVLKALDTKSVMSGLDQSISGYGFRAVVPILFQDDPVGMVEVGFDLGNSFLEMLDATYQGNWAIYNLARGVKLLDDHVLINAIGPEKDKIFQNLLPGAKVLSQIKANKPFFEMDENSSSTALYIPITNFQHDIALIIEYVGSTDYFAKLHRSRTVAAIICVIGLIISSLILYALFKMIITPIRELMIETENVRTFLLDEPITIKSLFPEVGELVDAMRIMKTGLQSFRKYIPDELVRQLIKSKQEAVVSGQRRNLTVFFSDVADFSEISERLTPNELTAQLSEYLTEMTKIILDHHGTVDKYIGDAIMAFWGAPIDMKDHANQACLAALACQKRSKQLAVKWQAEGKPIFNIRIGINTGDIVVGNIGSNRRLSYTVIGDAVNLASRLEGINKEYGTHIIMGQATLIELPDDFTYRLIDIVVVKGKTVPVPIYELVALKGDITSLDAEFMDLFSNAVSFYVQKDWARAKMRFANLLKTKPGDRACEIFIARCDDYEKKPPADDWAGEYVYKYK